jgi:hypothetical protein
MEKVCLGLYKECQIFVITKIWYNNCVLKCTIRFNISRNNMELKNNFYCQLKTQNFCQRILVAAKLLI